MQNEKRKFGKKYRVSQDAIEITTWTYIPI